MLPKLEKIKKNTEDQNTDQPGLFDKENEKERIAKKRKFVYIAMALTIGLSIIFSVYNYIKVVGFNIKMPTFSFKVSDLKKDPLTLPKEIDSNWSIFLVNISSNSLIYQQNQDYIFNNQDQKSILEKIDKSNFVTSSLYSSSLPQGLKIKELVEEKTNSFVYSSKIISPKQELFLVVSINNSNDLSQKKKLIPNLIDQLYWYSQK